MLRSKLIASEFDDNKDVTDGIVQVQELMLQLMFKLHANFNEMQIFVNGIGGKTITLDVSPYDTIDKLKAALEELDGIPPDQQRLIYAGKQLEDAMTVSSYSIPMHATLTMTMNLSGGAPPVKRRITIAELTPLDSDPPGIRSLFELRSFKSMEFINSMMATDPVTFKEYVNNIEKSRGLPAFTQLTLDLIVPYRTIKDHVLIIRSGSFVVWLSSFDYPSW
jgi:hypothetical protein